MAEDLKIILDSNEKFKDQGVKNIANEIPTHNNLKKLHLNFSDCGISQKSGVFIGKSFGKLNKVEHLEVNFSWNKEFKD